MRLLSGKNRGLRRNQLNKMRNNKLSTEKNIIFGIIILCIILIITGCTSYLKEKTHASSQEQVYKISSLVKYSSSLCGSTGFAYKPNSFNSGMKLMLKDKITGELLEGYGTLSSKEGGGSANLKNYSCQEEIYSENVLVSAYAKGYTPLVFNFKYPKNQLATVEVFMIKSCSGGPSFFDDLKLSNELLAELIDNQTLANEYLKGSQDRFYDTIKIQFGLEKADYSLQCIESYDSRGGYIKAKGTYKDGSPLELYYHLGWCSSGGSDCGWSICFTSNLDSLFQSVKNNTCNKIYSLQSHDDICINEAYDHTEEVKNECLAGKYENINGNKKSIAINQIAGRCTSSVEQDNFNCLEH